MGEGRRDTRKRYRGAAELDPFGPRHQRSTGRAPAPLVHASSDQRRGRALATLDAAACPVIVPDVYKIATLYVDGQPVNKYFDLATVDQAVATRSGVDDSQAQEV